MKAPRSVRILGREFRLRWRLPRSMPDAFGECYREAGRIDLARGQKPLEETDTVLHEVMHAILYAQGRPDGGDTEEQYVRALSSGLVVVLRENPELVAYLTRDL